ncbi:MAG: low molecular weight phosphotyrosine protein phosphatase [Gammaproteobacteria bacterium]|nr:MAG: low molecular weight phosphotyrosine protein phosphatase [Gammaproteobacteria bacterium]
MGNICRSPTAHGVFQNFVDGNDLNKTVVVDSAGTHAYHIGKKPDERAISTAAKRNYNLSKLRARQVVDIDFKKFDYLLAMDNENYSNLLAQCDIEYHHKVKLFLEFATVHSDIHEVPDPYYGCLNGFETVLDLVEDACKGLLEHIKNTHFPNSE